MSTPSAPCRGDCLKSLLDLLYAEFDAIVAVAAVAGASAGSVSGSDLLESIRAAMGELSGKGGVARAVLINPLDWAELDIKAMQSTLNGAIFGANVFGLAVVASPQLPAGSAYVFDTRALTEGYWRLWRYWQGGGAGAVRLDGGVEWVAESVWVGETNAAVGLPSLVMDGAPLIPCPCWRVYPSGASPDLQSVGECDHE